SSLRKRAKQSSREKDNRRKTADCVYHHEREKHAIGERAAKVRGMNAVQTSVADSPAPRLADSSAPPSSFIERLIERSARNKFLVFVFPILAVGVGLYVLRLPRPEGFPVLGAVQLMVTLSGKGARPTW